ncbi:alpha/beta fold hydrolase [Motilimonas sp. 1_MG-2023]|uniref:alpha/beta fold hydrolase n=1 Tax=Motilimonas TaxID=1914248 RepID=UPI0026E16A56|nr:alpha/beta hydrolase [Motilimonas sp. 1_MG-2023]MDO6525116.1 alpha/beta hydrolase [Motilimonas sp. 1_MG-2023]
MIIKTGYIEVNSSRVYYQISGNRAGEPLLMLHGGLGSGHELKPIHQYLGNDFQLISVDFRGHGKSLIGSLPLSYQLYQQDVEAVLRYLAIDRYAIFGFSDGGIVGYRLAAQAPSRVISLITLGAQWRLNAEDPSMQLLANLTADFWRVRFADDVALYERSNPEPDFSKLLAAVKQAWFDNTKSGYPGDLVKQIICPTLIMRGDNDFIFSLDEAIALKSKISACSFANIPLTAHATHQEAPDIVGAMVKRFILKQRKLLGNKS